MAIKGVLFDFDGTLTRPGAIDFPAIKEELGCPRNHSILEYLETLDPESRARGMAILVEREDRASALSRPNRGAEACLRALRERGIPVGILTRNSLNSVMRALENFDGVKAAHFAAIITRESSLPKPHPHGVYQAAGKMGIGPHELLVAGDFRFDVMAGKAAGSRTALLLNGGVSPMDPHDPEPDYTLHSLEALLDLL